MSWGISSLACGSMYPASMWVLTVTPTSSIRLEDRMSVGHVVPTCFQRQLSTLLSAALLTNGTIVATWTRPLVVPPAFAKLGYIDITSSNMTLIAAGLWGIPAATAPAISTALSSKDNCARISYHSDAINGLPPVNFLSPSDNEVETLMIATDSSRRDLDALSPATHTLNDYGEPQLPTLQSSKLVSSWGVCGGQYSQVASITPATGGVKFLAGPGSQMPWAPGFVLQSVLDPSTRTIYGLAVVQGSTNVTLLSFNADTGATATVCTTVIPLPDNFVSENLGAAWDPASPAGSILVSFCRDLLCSTTLTVGRLNPSDCSLDPILTIPTDPSFSIPGSAAYDAVFDRYVFVAAINPRAGISGPVIAAVDLKSRRISSVVSLSALGGTVTGLTFDTASGNVFAVASGASGANPALYFFNTRKGTFAPVGSIFAGNALTSAGATIDPKSGLFYLVTMPSSDIGTQLVAVNMTDTSRVTTHPIQFCQYYLEDCPTGLFWIS